MCALSRREGKLILVTVTVPPVLPRENMSHGRPGQISFSAISLTFFNRQIFESVYPMVGITFEMLANTPGPKTGTSDSKI